MTANRSTPVFAAIATLGPVGKLPIAPGTWGSGVTLLIWWFALAELSPVTMAILIIVLAIIAIPVSGSAEKILGRDAGSIVIDEVVGQLIVLSVCQKSILQGLLAFFLFRLFDVWKPFPINASQKLKGGLGVVIDDVLAGIYSAIVILIIRRFWLG
ncbi:phosphatidylglycerophosphatase A [bacterium]|nr:phosphatidylglycerophosphatase A [bacterium]